ncbi:DUF3105 domain-containing protein [Deinococcus cellulosilyticus]|uniref:DUF3105 domain-containing protein n=1 Tax=Deinococcus cellulosilyticus (strain DSM 18568 / NBRC 106333 / KACC 11606 / 5516J-15) TaxID=1223518 RepID=A0A511MWS4_DEIC1|nr:DUF3105 domain-containing protein [Deinococcus cellulosilyticus]GEM44576.1 hypothetical protein DC3_02110 [Deinococcus cellulosilyticus NBRC 106333 = KACC 11606]
MKRIHSTLLLVAGLIGLAACNNNSGNIEGVESFKVAQGHKEGQLSYEQTPPVGGEHNPIWQNCGVYEKPLYNEYAVHSLEHGAVWITYQPDLPKEEVDKLIQAAKSNSYTLVSPFPGLDSKVALAAWGKMLKLDSADDKRIGQFISTYAQSSTNAPEPGAACSGGYSETR